MIQFDIKQQFKSAWIFFKQCEWYKILQQRKKLPIRGSVFPSEDEINCISVIVAQSPAAYIYV